MVHTKETASQSFPSFWQIFIYSLLCMRCFRREKRHSPLLTVPPIHSLCSWEIWKNCAFKVTVNGAQLLFVYIYKDKVVHKNYISTLTKLGDSWLIATLLLQQPSKWTSRASRIWCPWQHTSLLWTCQSTTRKSHSWDVFLLQIASVSTF